MSLTLPAPVAAPRVSTLAAALALGLLGASASAQSFEVIVSTSADSDLNGAPVADEALVQHAPGQPARLALPAEGFAALAGDDGGGLQLTFGDVDAVHLQPAALVSDGLLFSLVSDEHGLRDGDVLRLGAGGPEVVLSEDDLLAAIGSLDGNLDVDAVHRDADGTWLFSLAEDEDSAVLSGDLPGEVQDGAILAWLPGQAQAFVLHTESAVDAMVAQALGATGGGDVKGLSRDPGSGALLFSVQSPSAHDGSVFSAAGGGQLVPGHEEADFGFGGAVELDALAVAPVAWPGLAVDEPRPPAGGSAAFRVSGAPDAPHLLLVSAGLVATAPALGGWGGLVLGQDALFGAASQALPFLTVVTDGLGQASLSIDVPLGQPPADVFVQAFRLGGLVEASNPIVVEVAQ